MNENPSPRYLWGMDLSLSCTGIAIYDLQEKQFVYIGSFSTEKMRSKKNRDFTGLRLKAIGDWLLHLVDQFPPYYVAVERGFSHHIATTQVLFRVHGMVNYLFWDHPLEYFPPTSVKLALVHGKATKEDVANAILTTFRIDFSNEDESDAFAVALTALVQNELLEWEKPDWHDIQLMRKPKEPKKAKPRKKKDT